ncbi:hypothetical protein NQ314_000277 [Rhamnusium bicolor]|uniref:NudC domain-containing protein 1 n=1 Tax=Rhamnusium bicolor TaxID=1586634 RepID=A0AAV8ZYN6_9CUCU|nr:hypothetical protein NQ314_000277 [Rhamnusium bicolor]
MDPILIDLSPNKLLLDSKFDGYKLSLNEIPCKKKELAKPVDRILLNSSQYTLLHAKLYGLHNHLIGDHLDESDSVYFIDSDWNVCKTYVDPFSNELIEVIIVWQVPKSGERKNGDYNVSLKFVNNNIAVIADGAGIMHVVNTGSRNDDDIFTLLFSDKVIGQDEGFIVVDAVCKAAESQKEELHVVLLSIKQDIPEERFSTILHWISLSKSGNEPWQQEALKQLKINGDIQYAALERECNAVYVVSDNGCKFTINSDSPVMESKNIENKTKTYQWTQNIEDISIKFLLPESTNKELINVKSKPTEIEIKYNGNNLLCGQLYQRIASDMTTWSFENNYLEVVLNKSETGLMWPELVKDDQAGEYILDTCIVQEVQDRMAHLSNTSEDMPQSGTTFNSEQVEECDFETDKAIIFERLSGRTNNVTHKVYLGSHQVLLTANLSSDLPPALGIRHDVDVCLWQPQGCGDDFSISHNGTLLAFGYVQASKQNRKFSACAPDMSYSVICESSRHLFIYRQTEAVSSSELRNRSTGRRIQNIAQQQVVNISNDEIIGIYAANKTLFLLCENSITALKL